MNDTYKKTLEKQLELLSERSETELDSRELALLTESMLEIIQLLAQE